MFGILHIDLFHVHDIKRSGSMLALKHTRPHFFPAELLVGWFCILYLFYYRIHMALMVQIVYWTPLTERSGP